MQKIQKKLGFTLLEILVVIGIISILVALGAVSYSTAQKKSRDAKRKTDLKQIQNALEEYYSICGYQYPSSLGTSVVCPTGSVTILTPVPNDPKSGSEYPTPVFSTTSYQVCTYSIETESITGYCVNSQQ